MTRSSSLTRSRLPTRARAARVLLASAAAMAAIAACVDDGPVPRPCSDIPAGGCPLSRGVACEDPSCEAVYACREGNVWELAERCPPRDAAAPVDAFVPEDGGRAFDASVDAPPGSFGGPGCMPLLEPDCPLGIALSCGQGCCGCEDLFVCEEGGWSLWGSCGPGGVAPSSR